MKKADARRHVVITGTGRAGTTFLVELLSRLGLDTGFGVDDVMFQKVKEGGGCAGLEHDIRRDDSPYIVKNPKFGEYAQEVMCREDIVIDYLLIPIRDLTAAADSRRRISAIAEPKLSLIGRLKHLIRPRVFAGGLTVACFGKPGAQEAVLLQRVYNLLLHMSETSVPVIFMRYPRIVKDCRYLFDKMKPILGDVSYGFFCDAFKQTARVELTHSYNEDDS